MSPLSLCFVKLFSDWLLSIGDNGSHANVRKKSNIANRSKSHCERSHAICERSHANFKQRIACDLRIANEVEMGLKDSQLESAGHYFTENEESGIRIAHYTDLISKEIVVCSMPP